MIQAIMNKPREISFQDVPIFTVGIGQIKIKMKRIGVCGSCFPCTHGMPSIERSHKNGII